MTAKILVVEDDDALRAILIESLRDAAFDVQEARSIAELQQRFRGPEPEVVILDLLLPDGTSLEHLPELRSHWHDCSVIILTGHGTVDVAEEAFKQHGVFLLSKPFDAELLKGVIDLARSARDRRHEIP